MSFLDRVISIVILYIVSPFSVASSIVDDGSHFKLWRDQVLVKFFSSYGMIIALNIFIMLTSLVIDPNLHFFDNSFLNFCIKVLVILGSALGLNRSMGLIGNLISSGAGSNELRDAAATRGNVMKALSMPLTPATALAKEALYQKKRDIVSNFLGTNKGGKDGAEGKNGGDNGDSPNSPNSNQNTNSPNYNNNKKGVSLAITDNFGMNNSNDENKDNNKEDNKNDNKPDSKGKNLVALAITNSGNGGGNL
jgi:hypothetical protein